MAIGKGFDPLPMWAAILLAVAAATLIQISQCNPHGIAIEGGMAAVLVTVMLWINHLHYQDRTGLKKLACIVAGAVGHSLGFFLLLILALLPFTLLGTQDCYPSGRMNVARLVFVADEVKSEISQIFEKDKTLDGIDRKIKPLKSSPNYPIMVDKDGQIIAARNDPVAYVIMTPHVDAGRLTWSCHVEPQKLAPKACTDR